MATEHRAAPAGEPASAASRPGVQLRAAREAAGLSLDQVAQQLKLAPRQVKALEDEDFAHLPGRTFTRGFVRNYARLLNLDARELLARLPNPADAPELGAPPLHATGAMIAELPSSESRAPGLGRWLIPLVLVGCVVVAAAYEWYRGGLGAPGEAPRPPAAASRPPDKAAGAKTSVDLPNPLAVEARSEAAAATPPAGAASAGPLSPAPVTAAAQAALEPAPLVLTYRGPSWTEIRDRDGQVLVAALIPAGSEQAIRGTPPFDLVIGNADAVTLVYRGQPVDLAPYTRQNVARLRLS